mmetsp:Transcript_62511/g.161014  ORF Transcript_62511/g.161014 Transcript_62511/m.161014 type:complete len:98 (-) Transcript_62511:73-366(-)
MWCVTARSLQSSAMLVATGHASMAAGGKVIGLVLLMVFIVVAVGFISKYIAETYYSNEQHRASAHAAPAAPAAPGTAAPAAAAPQMDPEPEMDPEGG